MKLAIVLSAWAIAAYVFCLRFSVGYTEPFKWFFDLVIGFCAPWYWLITGREINVWARGESATAGFAVGVLTLFFSVFCAGTWSVLWVLE